MTVAGSRLLPTDHAVAIDACGFPLEAMIGDPYGRGAAASCQAGASQPPNTNMSGTH